MARSSGGRVGMKGNPGGGRLGDHDHAGKECSGKEMRKAWDGPGGQGMSGAGKVADVGGMKREAGASDPGELK
jgi:hypothetical protein